MSDHHFILEDWQKLTSEHLNPTAYLFDHPKLPMADQDIFNAVLQTVKISNLVSIQMPDWRAINLNGFPFFHIGNFRPHAFLHCTGASKPWKLKSIPSRSPTAYDDLWFTYLTEFANPINAQISFSWLMRGWFRRNLLSRFISRAKRNFTK